MARKKATSLVKSRYNRMARLFDFLEHLGGPRLKEWRLLLWSKAEGKTILEVGVGTGANFPFYPPSAEITAIDFSPNMLKLAWEKADRLKTKVKLEEMDVESLEFSDDKFDTVVASLVFCSVPDVNKGLLEIKRVVKLGGKIVMLEHVLSSRRYLNWMMNAFNPVMYWLFGDNINRRTVEDIMHSGLKLEAVHHLNGIFKLIEARK